MNPLLQRFLISWAAGLATTGVIVGTAKQPHKVKRRRRKKKKGQAAEPVQIGAQALADARAPDELGLSVEEWAAGVKALPSRVAGIFTRVPKQGQGAREPDEIRTADGEKVAGGARKRRRRGKRKQATLWDSAKESMRQTVHEVVKEEVKDTPVGNAVDAAKKAGDKVKEGAAVVKEGAAVVAENAVRVGAQVGGKAKSLLNRILEAVEAQPPSTGAARNADPEVEALAAREEQAAPREPSAPPPPAAVEAPAVASPPVEPAAAEAPLAQAGAGSAPRDPGAGEANPVDVAEVGRKLKSGLTAVGDWLQGPGSPGYTSTRARPAQGGSDVVEAKDAGAPAPSAPLQRADDDQRADQQDAEHDEGAERRREEAGE